MQVISSDDIVQRIRLENPWWAEGRSISEAQQAWKPRAYFRLFFPLVQNRSVRRAVVLMGPRRVGKTVMIHHAIQSLIAQGTESKAIGYLSVDHPIYNGLSLEKFAAYYSQASGVDLEKEEIYLFLDEIQYLRNWENHLKSAVDTYSNIKFIVSGSAAAALRLKSQESGAGRFTDFLLPPLTFYEYLDLLGKTDQLIAPSRGANAFVAKNIDEINERFLSYMNFGGYPEVIFSPHIQADPGRFIKNDIIDKVLLRDLPSLYGIGDIQELNYLFTTLAFNSANEVSLNELSQNSGVAKNTIKRYIEYLEAAFLIRVVHRIDHSAKRFDRANFFKVYLTNPSMRAALFSPLGADDDATPNLVETAVFSQWFHGEEILYYARWREGEVDLVGMDAKQKPRFVTEVKWTDRYCDHPGELASLLSFCKENRLARAHVTSRTRVARSSVGEVTVYFLPASVYCYNVGYFLIHGKNPVTDATEDESSSNEASTR